MSNLRFVKVGDINTTYPYLEVYLNNEQTPFMDIGVNDKNELEFLLYESERTHKLSFDDIKEILQKATAFLPAVIKDEETYRQLFKDPE